MRSHVWILVFLVLALVVTIEGGKCPKRFKKRGCKALVLTNTIRTNCQPPFKCGEDCHYECVPGCVRKSGAKIRTCRFGRYWRGGRGLKCSCRPCRAPPDVRDASVIWGSGCSAPFNAGTACNYRCNPGFRKEGGDETKMCVDSQWRGSALNCEARQCPTLLAPAFGSITPAGPHSYPTQVTFSCNTGYVLNGPSDSTCQANGTWTSPASTSICTRVQCPLLTAPINGAQTPPTGANFYQDRVTFTCDAGYARNGSSDTTCQADGTWTNPVPTCTPVQCPLLTAPTNGARIPPTGANFYQDVVTFTCNTGYVHNGPIVVTCQADETWSDPFPTCTPRQCSALRAPEFGLLSPTEVTSYQTVVTFACIPGFALNGSPNTTCQADGSWSNPVPTCTPSPNWPTTSPTTTPPVVSSCGNLTVFNSDSGSFTSPGWPDPYPLSTNCTWQINVDPGKFVLIRFVEFDLEHGGRTCIWDSLRIHDGPNMSAPMIANLCGSSVGPVITTGSSAFVVFHSDESVTDSGFFANFTAWNDTFTQPSAPPYSTFATTTPATSLNCGNPTVLSGNIGSFTSPGYPGNYPNNAYCSWQISVNTSEVIAIRFNAFDLEFSGSSCPYDYLAIYDGSSTAASRLARLCGSSAQTIYTTGRNAYVVFRTDGSVTGSGFSANFTAESRGPDGDSWRCDFDSDQCNSMAATGQFGFRWIRRFGRTPSSSTGPSADHTDGSGFYMYTEASGSSTGANASLTLPIMRSDGQHCLRWFYHMYGSSMGTLNVYVSQPQYPDMLVWSRSGNQGNRWLPAMISVSTNTSVFQIRFEGVRGYSFTSDMAIDDIAVRLGPCSSCAADQFTCWNGSCIFLNLTCDGNSDCNDGIDEVFCNQTIPHTTPSYRTVAITTSPASVHCGNPTVLSGNIGSFTSPGYPGNYPNNAQCSWQISVNTSEAIAIRFNAFDLQDAYAGVYCLFDYLAIYDGPSTSAPLLARLCGSSAQTIVTTNRSAFVIFRTDGSVTKSGFFANFTATERRAQPSAPPYSTFATTTPATSLNCGNPTVLSGNIGSFTSPGYPGNYPNNARCSWQISVNTSEVIAIRFNAFNLESGGSSCPYDYLDVYDGLSTAVSRLARLCGSSAQTVFTTGRNAFVVFRTDGSVTRSGFSAYFTAESRPERRGWRSKNERRESAARAPSERGERRESAVSAVRAPKLVDLTSSFVTFPGVRHSQRNAITMLTVWIGATKQTAVTIDPIVWEPFNFTYDNSCTSCDGESFVRPSSYTYGGRILYVGVVLCSPTQYKIFLSDNIAGMFRNIGDHSGHGQDHCELVGTSSDPPSSSLDPDYQTCSGVGYWRYHRGNSFTYGAIGDGSVNGNVWYGRWYRCGVTIPRGEIGWKCDFDADQCNSMATPETGFRWLRRSGSTPSSLTGPSADHTDGSGSYMYTDARFGFPNSNASLSLPIIRSVGQHCLRWFYHMYGSSMGTLNVYVSQPQYPDMLVWTRSGSQGNRWLPALSPISTNSTVFQYVDLISSSVTIRSAYRSQRGATVILIALIGATKQTVTETRMAGVVTLIQISVTPRHLLREVFDGFDALAVPHPCQQGHQQTIRMVPVWFYMYTEASSGSTGATVSLTLPVIRSDGQHCLRWFYHMYGSSMGTLNVYVSQPQYPDMLVWTRSGDQGNRWLLASLPISNNASVFQIRFEGIRGASFRSDMAIDDIAVRSGACSTCAADQFTCWDGSCISFNLTCDGSYNCRDGSDEAFCNYTSTQPTTPFSTTYNHTFAITTPPPSVNCSNPSVLAGFYGNFTSPGYPGNYPNNARCSWLITVSSDKIVLIRFTAFNLESASGCRYDALAVHDGPNATAPVLATLCGSSARSVSTTGNSAFLVFTSDGSVTGSGFFATFTAEDPPPTCSPEEFTCWNGDCINMTLTCDGTRDCAGGSDEIDCVDVGSKCGVPAIQPTFPIARIVGGNAARPGSWPWQAYLLRYGSFRCGGNLIHPLWILTAAHCVNEDLSPGSYNIIMGKYNKSVTDSTEQRLQISQIIMHSEYNTVTFNKDLALLKLAQPVTLNQYVWPVCLVSGPGADPPEETICVRTGNDDVLKQARIPLVSNDRCDDAWYAGRVTEFMMCAGYYDAGGHGVCSVRAYLLFT
ncbi:BMP1 [Branchiostoma lanceolatum]|uniref:BMP1 protein n=1 Tax=Branchiostoma lanceolatum TaxID=7740 RepID=A0A8K0AFW5_BRALA|nr:BMP1 [Branchiostoma lanceolatum]